MRVLETTSWLTVFLTATSLVAGGNPVNIQATLRGKKYTIPNVVTVGELQKSIEDQTGLSADKQGVLFGGKKLASEETLENAGVEDGNVVNIVPATSTGSGSSGKKKKKKDTIAFMGSQDNNNNSVGPSSSASAGGDFFSGMETMMQEAGIDESKMEEMMNSMGGAGGGGGGMPDMMESMKQMQQMMQSPLFKQFMSDPEKLEQSRQMILQNPMMKSMMAGLPGFDDILNDQDKWRETMIAASQMYEQMGGSMETMMNSMGMGGAGGAGSMEDMMSSMGMGGAGAGGFGGFPNMMEGQSNSALDELSED